MAQNVVLVGSDVRAYYVYGNGYDGSPITGTQPFWNMLGVYKSIKVNIDWTRAKVKPSSQVVVEKRLTDWDWTATLEHQVRYGGSPGMQLLLNHYNVIVQFQEEPTPSSNANVPQGAGGWWWTLYGGVSRFEYNIVNEERTETLTVENIGLVNGNACLYYSPQPVSVSQAVSFAFGPDESGDRLAAIGLARSAPAAGIAA